MVEGTRQDMKQGRKAASFARVRRIFMLCAKAVWQEQSLAYRAYLILAFVLLGTGRFFGFFIAISLGWLVDHLGGDQPALAVALGLIAVYASAQFFSTLVEVIGNLLFTLPQGKGQVNVSTRVFANLIRLPLSFHIDQRTGGLANAFDRGSDAVGVLTRILLFGFLPIFFQLAFALVLVTNFFGPVFFPLVLGICLGAGYTTYAMNNWYRRLSARVLESDDKISEQAVDSLMNVEAVKIFNRTEYEINRLGPLWDVERLRLFRLARAGEVIRLVNTGIQALCVLGLGAYMAWRVVAGLASPGDFVAFIGIINQLFLPIRQLAGAYRSASRAEQDASRFFEFLDKAPEEREMPPAARFDLNAPALRFEQVDFGHRGRDTLMKGLTLTIEQGSETALVGATGSGKSTLTKLALALEIPQAGIIKLFGQDLSQVPLNQLRTTLALTPQNVGIFAETIAFNLRFGKPEATDADLISAAKTAQFHDFVQSLPDGYETKVGEGGQKLSGGERQRLALARSLLREAEIYIFDEATSALDLQTEVKVMAGIRERLKGKTLIFIAHRLTTVQSANLIVVLDKAKVVELGSHSELLALEGVYKRLWRTQNV